MNDEFTRTLAAARHQAEQKANWFSHCLRAFVANEVTTQLIEDPDELNIDLILVMGAQELLNTLAGGSVAVEAAQVLADSETGE